MNQQIQPIWQITGDSVGLIENLNLDRYEQDPRLDIHAGQGTLEEARQVSSSFHLIKTPKQVPDPLIAFAAVDVFSQADIFDSDAPCLVVGPTFMAEFHREIEASCREFAVKVVMYGSSDVLEMSRGELLNQVRPDLTLYALAPLKTIKTRRPIERDDMIFVSSEEQLPPFFRVPWRIGSVFVRDDIHQRIEGKFRGAEFNLDPSPL